MATKNSHTFTRSDIPQPACFIDWGRAADVSSELELSARDFSWMSLQQVNRLSCSRVPNLSYSIGLRSQFHQTHLSEFYRRRYWNSMIRFHLHALWEWSVIFRSLSPKASLSDPWNPLPKSFYVDRMPRQRLNFDGLQTCKEAFQTRCPTIWPFYRKSLWLLCPWI